MTVRTAEAAHGTDGGQFVVTRLGNESYAIAITAVREIVRMQRMTEIPLTDDSFVGLTKLRETVIPVAELRRSLGLQAGDTTAETRIVVVDAHGRPIGFVVDAVTGVISAPAGSIEPLASTVSDLDSAPLEGVLNLNDQLILLVDIEKLVGGMLGAMAPDSLSAPQPATALPTTAPAAAPDPAGDDSALCDACAATGLADGQPCPACAGTGLAAGPAGPANAAEEDPEAARLCEQCHAMGITSSGKDCPCCSGSGLVAA